MPVARTQAQNRRDFNAEDQFGRLWLGTIEIATGDPCGPMEVAGWDDPLRTPQKYIRVSNAFGLRSAERSPVYIDFDAWVRDQMASDDEWKQSFYAIGRNIYKDRFDAVRELKRIGTEDEDEYLMSLAGPRPWPSVEVLLKARAGHRRLLGLDPLDRETRKWLRMETIDDLEAGLAATGTGNDEQTATDAVTRIDESSATPPSETWPQFLKRVVASGEAKNTQEAAALWNAAKTRR